MERITENERKKLGYQYVYASDSETTKHKHFEERLRSAVARINPALPAEVREEAIKQVQRRNSPELIANNEAFHHLLTADINASYQVPRQARGRLAINPEKSYYISGFTKAI